VNDYGSGTFVYVEDGATPAQLINNLFVGPGTLIGKFDNSSGQLTTNLQTNAPQLVNIAGFDYHLNPGSPAIDAGSNPGTANGFDLTPVSQYVHPLQSEDRSIYGSIDLGAYEYAGSPTSVELIKSPSKYQLQQNYPNPFNPETAIRFQLPEAGDIELTIYNLRGQKIRTLLNAKKETGLHSVSWNSKDDAGNVVASGVYIYLMKAGEFVDAKKLTLLR